MREPLTRWTPFGGACRERTNAVSHERVPIASASCICFARRRGPKRLAKECVERGAVRATRAITRWWQRRTICACGPRHRLGAELFKQHQRLCKRLSAKQRARRTAGWNILRARARGETARTRKQRGKNCKANGFTPTAHLFPPGTRAARIKVCLWGNKTCGTPARALAWFERLRIVAIIFRGAFFTPHRRHLVQDEGARICERFSAAKEEFRQERAWRTSSRWLQTT